MTFGGGGAVHLILVYRWQSFHFRSQSFGIETVVDPMLPDVALFAGVVPIKYVKQGFC